MFQKIKACIRYRYYRSPLFRRVMGWISVVTGRSPAVDVSQLRTYREADSIGPLEQEEALFLFGLTRVLRPRTVVEFGFFQGHSAFNFLRALEADAKIFSYDPAEDSLERYRTELSFDDRLVFLPKSQSSFSPADIDHRTIDLVFFDGCHEFEINCLSYEKIKPHLSESAIIIVHDTGLWQRDHFLPLHERFITLFPGEWIGESHYAHQPDERRFVDWISSEDPQVQAIHLHSSKAIRHGITLLQRKAWLSRKSPH